MGLQCLFYLIIHNNRIAKERAGEKEKEKEINERIRNELYKDVKTGGVKGGKGKGNYALNQEMNEIEILIDIEYLYFILHPTQYLSNLHQMFSMNGSSSTGIGGASNECKLEKQYISIQIYKRIFDYCNFSFNKNLEFNQYENFENINHQSKNRNLLLNYLTRNHVLESLNDSDDDYLENENELEINTESNPNENHLLHSKPVKYKEKQGIYWWKYENNFNYKYLIDDLVVQQFRKEFGRILRLIDEQVGGYIEYFINNPFYQAIHHTNSSHSLPSSLSNQSSAPSPSNSFSSSSFSNSSNTSNTSPGTGANQIITNNLINSQIQIPQIHQIVDIIQQKQQTNCGSQLGGHQSPSVGIMNSPIILQTTNTLVNSPTIILNRLNDTQNQSSTSTVNNSSFIVNKTQIMNNLELLEEIIELIERIPPDNEEYYEINELISLLIKYCYHIAKKIAIKSKKILKSLFITRSSLRCLIIEEFILFIIKFNLDHHEKFVISILNDLNEFIILFYQPVLLYSMEIDFNYLNKEVLQQRNKLNIYLVESFILLLFCNSSIYVRGFANKLILEFKKLFEFLPNYKNYSPENTNSSLHEKSDHSLDESSVFSILYFIEKYEKKFIDKIKLNDFSNFPPPPTLRSSYYLDHSMFNSFQDLITGCSEYYQEPWANFLGFFIRKLKKKNIKSIYYCFSIICTKLDNLNSFIFNFPAFNTSSLTGSSSFSSSSSGGTITKSHSNDFCQSQNPFLITWRNYILLTSFIGDPVSPSDPAFHSLAFPFQNCLFIFPPFFIPPSHSPFHSTLHHSY